MINLSRFEKNSMLDKDKAEEAERNIDTTISCFIFHACLQTLISIKKQNYTAALECLKAIFTGCKLFIKDPDDAVYRQIQVYLGQVLQLLP